MLGFSKGAITVQYKTAFIAMLIILVIFIAVLLLFGKQIVEVVLKHLPWKVIIKCDPAVTSC